MFDTDELDYFPLKNGVFPPSSVKMDKMSRLPLKYRSIFQIDKHYQDFADNKNKARAERLGKYYQTDSEIDKTPVIKFFIRRLTSEHPKMFRWYSNENILKCSGHVSLVEFDKDFNFVKALDAQGNKLDFVDAFDAVVMLVPEDIVICSLDSNGQDYISSAYLTSPAGWSAEWAFKKTFAEIHGDVKKIDSSPVIKNPVNMVRGIIGMPEAVQRVGAISFRSDMILNLHPEEKVEEKWTWDDNQEVFIRFERQTVTPFPEINSFLFTVRPYWASLLHPKRIDDAIKALQNVDPNAYYHKFTEKHGKQLLNFLNSRRKKL